MGSPPDIEPKLEKTPVGLTRMFPGLKVLSKNKQKPVS